MIKFFRRLRQKLLEENRFSKYLLYAFGEIILVVIGILIALQVNTWNESRKDIKQEQVYLKNMRDDLQGIIEAYHTANLVEDLTLQQSKDILKHFELNKGFYNMDTIFPKINDLSVRWNVTPSATTLVELINSGQTKIIRNEQLRKELIAFNEQLNLWTANTVNNNTYLVDRLIAPEIFKLGAYSTKGYSDQMGAIFQTYSHEAFISTENQELNTISIEQLNTPGQKLNFINLVNYRHSLASLQKGVNNGIIERVEKLIQMIEMELSND